MINELLEPCGAEVTTYVEPGEDVRFVRILTGLAVEEPFNTLDDAEMMLHAEDIMLERLNRARSVGGPLLRILSTTSHGSSAKVSVLCEDVVAGHEERRVVPAHRSGSSPLAGMRVRWVG